MKLMNRPEWACFGLLVLAVVLTPALSNDPFMLPLIAYTCSFAIFALSVYVVIGWVGEIPLGQSLYYGLGAYATGILMKDRGMSFITATVVAMVLAVVLAIVVGLITLRLTGAYFAVVSWGLASVAVIVANSWDSLTGGALGLLGTPTATISGLSLSDPATYAWLAGTALVVIVAVLAAIRSTAFGQRLNGGRLNAHLVRAAGANIFRDRVIAFGLSAALAAAAGSLSISYIRIMTPDVLGLSTSVNALIMVLLGGATFLLGPVVFAGAILILTEQFQLSGQVMNIVEGVCILAVIMLAPGGLPDVLSRLGNALSRRRPSKSGRSPAPTSAPDPAAGLSVQKQEVPS